MKIYSSKGCHDYYDCAMAYGQDPLCVWQREFKTYTNIFRNNPLGVGELFDRRVESTGKLLTTNYYNSCGIIVETGYVFFCGEVYPFVQVENYSKDNPCFYTLDSLEKFLYKEYRKKSVEGFMYSRYSWRKDNIDSLKRFFLQTQEGEEFHRINNIPVYIISYETMYEGGSLKEFAFQKVKDPYTAFQELNMYVSGVLGGQSPKMIEIEDVVRLEGHGFDKKSSFRNMER